VFQYFRTDNDDAVTDMALGTFPPPAKPCVGVIECRSVGHFLLIILYPPDPIPGFTDFGGLDSELTAAQATGLPDVAVLPMVAHAVVPTHSVDVYAYGHINFDLPTVADIYLGTPNPQLLFLVDRSVVT
jgi:hypothetical protein